MIPEYDVVVIDEAHELSARVTQAATDELSVPEVERAARRAAAARRGHRGRRPRRRRRRAARRRSTTCAAGPASTRCPTALADALALVRDAARALISAFPKESADGEADAGPHAGPRGWCRRSSRTPSGWPRNSDADVLWLAERERNRGGDQLCVAPLQVWGPLRDKLLAEKTVVFTSATLMLGGDFTSVATSLGLKPERARRPLARSRGAGRSRPSGADDGRAAVARHRRRLAVRLRPPGHPVRRQAPAPARAATGSAPPQIDEIVDLVDAADGRTLGLFSSRRAAEAAAEAVRERLPHLTILAQGEAQLPELAAAVRRGPARLPVRHAQPVAGPRRPGRHLPAGAHRPDPVPAARRPADVGAAAGRRPGRRQRLHAGRRDPRRAAARAGHRPADPHHHRQGRGGDPRPAAGHRPLRRLPARLAAADVATTDRAVVLSALKRLAS